MFIWQDCYDKDKLFAAIVNATKRECFDDVLTMIGSLLEYAEFDSLSNQPIKEYVLLCLLESDNAFTKACVSGGDIGTLNDFAFKDIEHIYAGVFEKSFDDLLGKSEISSLRDYQRQYRKRNRVHGFEESLESMLNSKSASDLLGQIIEHIRIYGIGPGSGYCGYIWRNNFLHKIDCVEEIKFEDLYHIDYQKEVLLENTQNFIDGKSANNVLLCGTMGSGKSSCIKALLSQFAMDKLKIVELDKDSFSQIKDLMSILGRNAAKYIVYMDDLSFESDDMHYSFLKSALDGYLEKSYDNILFYATSNRRNIVKSTWSDRQSDEEIHENDVLNEKNSLVERFGIKLYFGTFSQDQYFNIIKNGLEDLKIEFNEDTKKEALIWERFYHTRSGRTASNFVKYYSAKQKYNNYVKTS